MKNLIIIFALILGVQTATAQHELGGTIGISNLLGDFGGGAGQGTLFLKDIEPRMFRPAAGVFYRYNFLKVMSIRGQFLYAGLASDDELSQDPARYSRGLKSKSALIDAGVQLELNFIPLKYCSSKNSFSPYIAGGIGISSANATITERDDDINSIDAESEYIQDGQHMGLNVPVTFGVKYLVKGRLMFGLEGTYRMAFTDRLDNYVRQQNDAYVMLLTNVSYVFCKGSKGKVSRSVTCPGF